ncbi:MAG: LPD38 domain-containing protein [Christensenellales bacterium]
MIYNLNKNKSNPVENYHRKLAERKYARDKSLKTRDEEINAESDYIQNTPEFESYTPAYDVNQNITQNVAEKTEEETNKGGFWGGLGYAIEQLGLGLVRSLEGISDYVVGGVAELFGQDEWADEQMRNDWINYDHANEWYNPDGVMQFVGDVASGVGGMLPSIGAAAIPGIGPALSTGMFMTSAAGQSVSDAAKQNEGLSGNEWLYGTGSGLVEGLVEKISGGTGKLLGKATGKMFGKQIAKSTAGKLAANFVGEGLEEVASDIIDPALRGITGVNSWEEVKRQYGDLPEQLPHTFLVGGTVGSVLGSADRAGRAIQAKGFNNLNAIENASEFKRVEGQNAQAAVKGGKVLDNTALREKLSDNLRKMDSAQRSEFISRNGLENYFNADGGIKSASENSIVSQGYNAQAYSENIANIDKDKLKYKPTANAIRPDIAQAVKDVTLLSDGNGQYVITDGLSDGVNGFYDRESGITYLSGKADAGDVRSYVASHELVHTLEGSRQYERFANTVLKEINSSEALKNKYNIDRYIQNYSAAHDGVAPETLQYIVQTEIVADFAAKEMLTDEAVLRRLINRDRNIVQRILDWVRDKIKILVSKGGDRSNIAFYKKAERQLAKALDNPTGGVSITAMDNAFKAKETSRNQRYLETENASAEAQAQAANRGQAETIRFSLMNNRSFENNVKDILSMSDADARAAKAADSYISIMKHTPDVILNNVEGAQDLEVIIRFDALYLASRADGALDGNYHDLGAEITTQLPQLISDPDAIVRMDNGRLNILAEMKTDKGSSGIISIELNTVKDINSKYSKYNLVVSAFSAKDNYVRNLLQKRAERVEYIKKDLPQVNHQLHESLAIFNERSNEKQSTSQSPNAETLNRTSETLPRIKTVSNTSIRERAEKSIEKSKNIEKNSETKSNEVGEEARYSIVNINAGRKAVLIKDNILDGVSKKDRLKTVYDTMKKFSNGIPIAGGRLIKVNAITRNEYINSKNAQYLKGNITKNTIFIDKMKSSGHLDEIVLASDSYVNEGLKHTRNDNIKEFARGNVLLDIAGNQYAANVIVGFTGSNMILYDVVDFKPTKFTVTEQNGKKIDAAEGANPFERATPSTTSIREKTEKSTEKSKNIEKNSELRYSLKPFAEQVDDVLAGKRSANLDLYVSETPDVFVKLGFPKTPMLMRNSKVKEILEKHMEMSVELIKQIPEAIQNPLFILKSKTNPNESVVAITEIVTDKGELIVPVWVNQDGVYLDIDLDKPVTVKTNFVASAYGRNVKGLLEYAADNDGILYVNSNKEKVGELLTRHGLQLPAPLRITDSNISIREKTEKSTEKSKNIEKNSELRYSLKPFAEQVDGALDRKLPKGDSVLVSEHTPEWIIKAGFDDLPMLITQKHLRDINTPEETVGKGNYHGISREKIKQLPIRLQNPVMLIDSLTDSRSIVVVTDMLDDKGRPVVVAVRADGSGMYLGIDIKSNFVTSFYGKDGFASFILKHINQENLLYWNKEKSRKLYDTIRVQFPQALTTYDSDIIIRMSEAKVNSFDKNNLDNRFSLKKIDSYTEKQYNDYGWVRANDVLSNREYSDFNSKLNNLTAEIRRNKTAAGEYIIPVNDMHSDRFGINNVLVFAKGTYQNPKITRIIRIKLDNETDIDLVRSKIYESKGIISDSYWDGILEIYNAETFQRREQREGSRAGGGTDSQVQNGERGTGSAGETADLIYSLEKPTEKVNSLREKGGDERNSLKNEITTYGNGMSVTQKPGKYSEVLTKVKIDKLSYGEMAKDTWTNFQINFSDAQTGIVKAGKKLGIEDIDAKTNYVRAAYNAANSMLDENQADISGKRVGDGLKKIFSPVYKKGEEYVKEFYTYLLLKHHADRIKVDKTVLGDLTAAEALQLAVQREIKYPEFKTLAAKVWKYNDNLLQYRVDTGLITAEAAAACRKLYPHYVPTFREGGSSGIGGLSGKYNLAVKSTLKTAKGSTLDIMPIDVIMARQTMEVVRAGRINQLKNSLYDALESRQNYSDMRVAGVERVNKVTEKLRLTAPVKAELYNTLDVDYSTMRDMNNQISFYKDGNRITLDVTPEVFAGFEDFAPNTVYRDKLIEVVAKGNTMFKKLVTSANPFFLVRNFFRDLQDSLFYTKHGIRRFLPSLAKAYKQIATKGEMWNEYLAAGGLSSGLFDYNTGIKRGGTGLKSLAERALNKLEYANMFIEQAPRLAEYMLSRQKGLSVEQSLLDSADVTTNFGRGGKTAKMLNRTVMPFLNPSIQGWSKLVRTVFGKKNVSQWIQLIVRSLLLGIGLTALNDLLNGDDEDYKAVSLRDKENYYLFNIGDGQFLKLPKGRVLSVFGSLYLRGKESAKGNANAWDGYLESAASAVSPVDNFTRTIFSPLTDAATNTTWYGGVIEGRGLQNLSPENRYDESTSEIAKALGKALNYSPKKIHYIIDQYSGVIGDIVLPMTTAKSERGLIASNFTVNTAVSNRYSGEFYDKLDEITYAKNDGDRNAAFKYRYLNDIAGEVSDMYAKRREIENSDLSQQDKSAQSEAVSVLISQTQKSAVKGLDVLDEILNSIDYDKRVAKLTQGFAYRQLTDDEKEKAAVKMYDYYYALAMNKAFGAELDRKQTICNMINDDRIFIYLAHISSLTADTDSNGNTINGSRKKKVETYVDGLPLSSLHKYLLMLLAGYKLGDIGKNKVAGYFNEAALDNSIRENLLSFVA